MAWFIMLLVWIAVTVLVGYPYVEKIEKLRSGRERFFSYFALAVGGQAMLIAELAEKEVEKTGVLKDNDMGKGNNNISLW